MKIGKLKIHPHTSQQQASSVNRMMDGGLASDRIESELS